MYCVPVMWFRSQPMKRDVMKGDIMVYYVPFWWFNSKEAYLKCVSNGVTSLCINSLWPSDTIWWHKSGSTLAQVMACCLMAPSHYLNQCWLIISKVQWHSSECKFTRDSSAISHWNWLENYLSKILFKSPRGQWVNPWTAEYALWLLLLRC